MHVTDSIINVGVKDKELRFFEGQYQVPDGVTYNSYLILDEKITVVDTVDKRAVEQWLNNLERELAGKEPYYLIVSHMEPDHSAGIKALADKYPNMKLVGNTKTFIYLQQMFQIDNLEERKVVVNEGEQLELGSHKLLFVMAPMVHWPEVMLSYEVTEKVLFSADAFGFFGCDGDYWPEEARRYFINIVGKYGAQVQAVLAKAQTIDIQTICPLHGDVLKENLGYYIEKYDTWSKYEPEEEGILIAYSSMHGHTKECALKLKEILEEKISKEGKNVAVSIISLNEDDVAEAVSRAFKYSKLVVASPTYDGELFPATDRFIRRLKSKGYQNRKVGFIENGTWAPMSAKQMREFFEQMKNITFVEPVVTIKTAMNEDNVAKMGELAEALLN